MLTWPEIGFRKKASSLVNSTTDESFASQATKPEEQVQLVSTRPVDRVNNTDMPYNTAPSNKSRHAGNPDDPLCVRLRHICKREDFRTEPWYLDNLYLIMCYFASEGIMVLSLVRSDNGIWALNALLPPFFALVYLTTIPLCGILQRIQQGKSERRLSFLVRLAVDSGMRYRVARWVYFVSAPVFVIIYVSMPVEELGNVVPAAIWCLVGFVVWFAGICSILSSVYSQVLS